MAAAPELSQRRFSPLQEDDDRFYALAVQSEGADRLAPAIVEWQKRSFDQWWADEKSAFSPVVKEVAYSYRAAAIGQ